MHPVSILWSTIGAGGVVVVMVVISLIPLFTKSPTLVYSENYTEVYHVNNLSFVLTDGEQIVRRKTASSSLFDLTATKFMVSSLQDQLNQYFNPNHYYVNLAAFTLFDSTSSTSRKSVNVIAGGKGDFTKKPGTGKYFQSNGRRRRQSEENACGHKCIVSLQKLLDDIIVNGDSFSITLQYRKNCSTLVYSQDNVVARLTYYDVRIKTTFQDTANIKPYSDPCGTDVVETSTSATTPLSTTTTITSNNALTTPSTATTALTSTTSSTATSTATTTLTSTATSTAVSTATSTAVSTATSTTSSTTTSTATSTTTDTAQSTISSNITLNNTSTGSRNTSSTITSTTTFS